MFTITLFPSEKDTKTAVQKEFKEFKKLAEYFNKYKLGDKLGAGFVRCACTERIDSACDDSNLIIIDGDTGGRDRKLIDPKYVHQELCDMNINHFIYTTWSHSASVNKYRVVIPYQGFYNKDQCKDLHVKVLKRLSDNGIHIKFVKEMGSFSQIWFLPRRAEDDGLFEFYSKTDGEDYEIESFSEKVVEEEKCTENTLDEMYNNIRTGKEFHESLRTISYQLFKDGMSKAHTKSMLRTLMDGSVEAGSERWKIRYDDIDRMVDRLDKVVDEEDDWNIVVEEKAERCGLELPLCEGLMGQFMKESEEFMMYKDRTIAFVSCMFIVSSIIGRKFNVDINNKDGLAKPLGLNVYLTLAAETGVGKSEIEDLVENCYVQFSGVSGKIQDFFYKGRLSGPKALWNLYKDQRCVGIITNEKGISDQSKLGDVQGMKDAWLNLYGQSSWKKWTSGSMFSDSDASYKSVKAVAISRIGESTPVELRKAYTKDDQVQNGLIPRESIFVLNKIQLEVNSRIRLHYSDEIVHKMEKLVTLCAEDCKNDMFKCNIITVKDSAVKDDMIRTQMEFRRMQDIGESMHIRAMSSRMFVKMLKYAGILTVMNSKLDDDNYEDLCIGKSEWEKSKELVMYEYNNINEVIALSSTGDDSMMDCAIYLCDMIVKMLTGDIGNKDGELSTLERKRKIIPASYFVKCCKGKSIFKELMGNPKGNYNVYKDGLTKTLDYLVSKNVLIFLEKNPLKRGSAYQITPNIELILDCKIVGKREKYEWEIKK